MPQLCLTLLVALSADLPTREWKWLPMADPFGWNADLVISSTGEIYVGYTESGGGARVRTWDGLIWVDLGEPSCGASWQNTVFFTPGGRPYFASRDYGSAGFLNVRRRRWDSWQPLTLCAWENGYQAINVASVHDLVGATIDYRLLTGGAQPGTRGLDDLEPTVLVLVNDGYPASDPSYSRYPPELQDEYPTVLFERAGSWYYLGSRRFSELPASYLDMRVFNDQVWVVYRDSLGGGRLRLQRYEPLIADWVHEAELLATPGENTALHTFEDQLVVVTNLGGTLVAYTLTGEGLVPLGGPIATGVQLGQQHWIQHVSCATDARGRIYVAYRTDAGLAAVSRGSRTAAGVTWEVFASTPITSGEARFVTMDIDARAERLYLGYTNNAEHLVVGYVSTE